MHDRIHFDVHFHREKKHIVPWGEHFCNKLTIMKCIFIIYLSLIRSLKRYQNKRIVTIFDNSFV